MGKIVKFDPKRRKSGKSWTRPEDYGAPPPPKPPKRPQGNPKLLAQLTVVALIAVTVAASIADLI